MIQLISISEDMLMANIEKVVLNALANYESSNSKGQSNEFYTREETARLLQVSLTTLYHWNNQGILQHTKIGSRVYYSKAEVQSKLKIAS